MIPYLPLEIIRLISNDFSSNEYYQLVLVNHAFYTLFIPCLYKTILIHNSQALTALLKSTHHHAYVRHLKVDQTIPSTQLDALPLAFPLISSLDLYQPYYTSYHHFHHLSSLSLYTVLSDTLLPCLANTPHLKRLHVHRSSDIILTFDLINQIHQTCPYLEDLCLGGQSAESTLPSISIQPQPRLHKLQLRAYKGMDHPCHAWLAYIAQAYPNLVSLTMGDYAEYGHVRHGQALAHRGTASFYRWFWSQCPRLNQWVLHGMVPDPALFQASPISDLTVLDPRFLYQTEPDLSRLSSLTVMLPDRMTCSDAVHRLGKLCPQLEALTLCRAPGALDLETVMDAFDRLGQLRLEQMTVYAKTLSSQRPHPLRALVMDGCRLLNRLFHVIESRCLELREFSMRPIDSQETIVLSRNKLDWIDEVASALSWSTDIRICLV